MDHRAETLFHELVDLSQADREDYFRQHSIPSEVRKELELLLQFDAESDREVVESLAFLTNKWMNRDESELARCGPYRLLRVLGKGGMGAVYLAERADGEVEQRVAIKFLHVYGGATVFRDRFLRERQILASLNHPGIARLVDAGHTAEGRPYLAMDYVDGTPIDAFAAQLDLRAKLALFLRVCDAVSYAHGTLIVHRDLKPSNILVDNAGNPKLLDFGIAKILDEGLDQTITQERLLTPEYASPEQIRGSAQGTATDIYSLGVVLYKLVTGQSPHGSLDVSREELINAVCNAEPVSPSSLVDVPHDVDFIVAKALRKEPEERYRSVEMLADDIRAFLEFRPVRARSGNAWYRTRKFARRYWVPVAAAAIVIASLAAGLYVANRERMVAQRRFQQVRQLSKKVIDFDLDLRDLAGATNARNHVISTSLEYLGALSADARGDPDLALEIADGYLQLARVQGFPAHSSLGRYSEAKDTLAKADRLVATVLTRDKANRHALLTSARIAHDRMAIATVERNLPVAFEQARIVGQRLESLIRQRALAPGEVGPIAYLYGNVAISYNNGHHFPDGIRAARRAIEISRGVAPARYYYYMALGALSSGLRWTGDLGGALDAAREHRKSLEALPDEKVADRLNLAEAYLREGRILDEYGEVNLGRPDEAIAVLEKSLKIADEIAERDPHDSPTRHRVADASNALANILRDRDPARALSIYDRALVMTREIDNNVEARRDEVFLLAGSSYALRNLHRDAEASQRIEAALAILREIKDYPAAVIVPIDAPHAAIRALADHYAGTGRLDKAAEVYGELFEKMMASSPDPNNDLRNAVYISNDQTALGGALRRLGRTPEADAIEAQRRELWRHWDGQLPANEFVRRQIKAMD